MTYDPVSGKVIAFGGFDDTGYLNDTWSFDGTSWAQIVTQSAPPPRAAAQMTYDSVVQKVVLFGGFDGTVSSEEEESVEFRLLGLFLVMP